jgi:putative PIN family toxin of toxin-antitoxin system
MRVVIDTNVLVSAALCAGKSRRVVLFVVDSEDIEWIVTEDILKEYTEVLGRAKFGLPREVLERWIELIRAKTRQILTTEEVLLPRDPMDAKFLACALSSQADYLITGDKDFSQLLRMGKTVILSVSLFDRLVVQQLI